jgi:hypothetical protein
MHAADADWINFEGADFKDPGIYIHTNIYICILVCMAGLALSY